jgi:HAD superfamily hydrolase (TIGR01509 family)
MIQAVFFDWYSTLANIDASRAEQYISVLRTLGIAIAPEKAMRGLLRADHYLTGEERRLPFAQRSREERADMYTVYPRMILAEAGTGGPEEAVIKVRDIMRERRREPRPAVVPVLFDDVIPTLKSLKGRGMILGVISNASRELNLACRQAGLLPFLDVLTTSQEAGARKPEPAIFQYALRQAGVPAAAAIFLGDQYDADVVGARNAGLRPLLIDRYDLYIGINDCPRLHRLDEVTQYLE